MKRQDSMAESYGQTEHAPRSHSNTKIWQSKTDPDSNPQRVHDIVCIGFGYHLISLAIALEETGHHVDTVFLESQPRSSYVPFTRLPGSFMQFSFLNDLITLENPRSRFSYVNYLHSTNQLIQFTNLGYMQPLREQFARYLVWCADQFKDKVRYGSEASTVRPVEAYGASVSAWSVEYVESGTGQRKAVLARQVVCAQQPHPRMPGVLSDPNISRSVLHSSFCQALLAQLSMDSTMQCHVAVVGNGQDAAEIVESLCSMRNQHRVTWIQGPPTDRTKGIDQDLAHHLYERQYSQRISESDPQRWIFQTHHDVGLKSAQRSDGGKIQLVYRGAEPETGSDGIVCDFVIAATGYDKLENGMLFGTVQHLTFGEELEINRHGELALRADLVGPDLGIWILEPREHGDKSLGRIATKARYLANSLVKKLHGRTSSLQQVQPRL